MHDVPIHLCLSPAGAMALFLGLTTRGPLQPLGELLHPCLRLAALGTHACCLPPLQGPVAWSHGPLPTAATQGPEAFLLKP